MEREKRSKLEQEKQRKKVENELRLVKENINIVERNKIELEDGVCKKNKEISALANKLHDEQALVAKGSKQIRECAVRKKNILTNFVNN